MSLIEVQATDQDLQDTGLTDPLQPPQQQPAVLADVGENLLLIPEPTPSDQVPAAPHAAPPHHQVNKLFLSLCIKSRQKLVKQTSQNL